MRDLQIYLDDDGEWTANITLPVELPNNLDTTRKALAFVGDCMRVCSAPVRAGISLDVVGEASAVSAVTLIAKFKTEDEARSEQVKKAFDESYARVANEIAIVPLDLEPRGPMAIESVVPYLFPQELRDTAAASKCQPQPID